MDKKPCSEFSLSDGLFRSPDGPIVRIQDTAHRAITLHQLERLVAHVEEQLSSGPWLRDDGSLISSLHQVTLYDLNHHLILPTTRPFKCSLVELLSDTKGPQPPDVFTSHYWGEPIIHLLRCLQQHAKDRGLACQPGDEQYVEGQSLGRSPRYWICAYANNQHNLDAELSNHGTDSVEQTSFVRAMRQSRGTVLVVDDTATCFSRLWCVYEIYSSLLGGCRSDSQYTFDFYTAIAKDNKITAVGIMDGMAAVDCNAEMKWERESQFPMERLRQGMSFDCRNGRASLRADEIRIHQAIGNGQQKTRLNNTVHGLVAATVLRRALESPRQGRQVALEALQLGRIRKLSLYMEDSFADSHDNMIRVIDSLDGDACELLYLQSDTLEMLPSDFGRFQQLKQLSFMGCRSLKCLPESFGELCSLQELHLQFCTSLTELPHNFGSLSSLSWISLDGCPIETLPGSFGQLTSLSRLYLTDCACLQQLPDNLHQLKYLKILHLNRCIRLERMPESLPCSLHTLQLERCQSLTRLPVRMQELTSLQTLNLWQCTGLIALPQLTQSSLTTIQTGGLDPQLVEGWEASGRKYYALKLER
ncbi:leucine Rich Repeat [Seminavis robusta]|uniref:Leucine Rich Repeat n=1 Tax=Seminavis robusta TaxID=568900 RepID=A0A9N8ENK9_9STRA|nr:leucine Rich Repeat [Seminavis robusta]|eukprot:Sro1633_g287420.1 leucine Rich Repeat (588) ;mRNA; f:17690-19453